ncbi:MAG: type VI secretion protein IcmF [Rhodoferax sp.]|nr:type VI secretion protein IcmF [Rhodoferax sp.]
MLTDQYFLISIAVLAIVVLLILGMVIYFAARRSSVKTGSDPKIAKLRFDSLRSSFRQAVELIESNIASRANRYGIPWIMVLNEGDSHRALPIEQSGVASALSTESASAAATQGISWHFFDRGIVIDIQGAYLGSPDDDDAAEKPWDEFLGLCRTYRPQRPFDSVVVTIPASLLLQDSADTLLEISKRAKLAHRRLWLAQNRFAMRFAVYVLVTGAEHLEGFSSFARALPEPLRASMLGWSSPYDLSATYQSDWIDAALSTMVGSVSDVSAELFAIGTAQQDNGELLLLPARIGSMRAKLQIYADELMRPSAYHEPFFFRGIYLTGDSGEAAQVLVANEVEQETNANADSESGGDLIAQLVRQPAFLRDLFEKKIFLEYGLTRPSRSQTLTRPVLHRALRWTAILFLGGWCVGLAVSTYQLYQHNSALTSALAKLQSDTKYRNQAIQRGESIPDAWYRNQALSLLSMSERLRTDRTHSFFMPGSWRFFDDFDARVLERIEREFGDVAVATLRRELLSRIAKLSGVEQDDSTGLFIIGASCKLPPSFNAISDGPRRNGLQVDELPEFAAVQRYLAEVEQLDQVLQALDRLRNPATSSADDLRTTVRYALGAELPADVSRSLYFFRRSAAVDGSALSLPIGRVQEVLRCALSKAMGQLDTRLFVNNELLATEQVLAQQWPSLTTASADRSQFAQVISGYRGIIAAIKEQEDLIASGKGGWMRQPSLSLGQGYDRTLLRITQNRLLGQGEADSVRARAEDGFQKFRSEFNLHFGKPQPGLLWNDKEGRFFLAPERVALRNALASLLSQPFMGAARDRDIPALPLRSVVVWDLPRLDLALSMGDIRKRYFAEGLGAFPTSVRPSIEVALNAHFSHLVVDLAAEAAAIYPVGSLESSNATDVQATTFEAAQQRLSKLQTLLTELGASASAEELRSLASRDALERVNLVDNLFTQSELYAMRGRDFKGWQGERGPMLNAFGVTDMASLAAYLGQQFTRAEFLGKQAQTFMTILDRSGATSTLGQRWQAINRDIERYRLKNPNSSILLLEQFMLTGAEITMDNCIDKLIGKAPASRPGDYFAERHSQSYNALLARCFDLHFRHQQEEWTQFATRFNQVLAGRHPFDLVAGRDLQIADPEDVAAILKAFEPVARTLKDSRLDSAPRAQIPGKGARRFVGEFERVRDFLAPLYPAEEGAVAGYDIGIEFRSNTPAEIEGGKIIDWSLEVGDQSLKLRDPPHTLRWQYGMPISLMLRIAKDSPLVAKMDPSQPRMLTDGRTIAYRFNNPWALFTFIARHRDQDTAQRSGFNARSQLLKIEFPVQAAQVSDAAQVPPGGRARVFLRVSLSPAGKKTPAIWPLVFPVRAPEWNLP